MSKRKLKHEDSLDSLEGSDSKKVHAGNENLHEVGCSKLKLSDNLLLYRGLNLNIYFLI